MPTMLLRIPQQKTHQTLKCREGSWYVCSLDIWSQSTSEMRSDASKASQYPSYLPPAIHPARMAEPSGPPPPQRRDSSTQHTTFSIPPLRSFIPVTEEKASSLSPRGQRLSQLIQNRAVSDPQRKPSFRLTDTRGETDSTDLERAAGFNAEQTDRRKSLERIRVSGDGRGIETDFEIPAPPAGFPLRRTTRVAERRLSSSGSVLDTPMMRSQRLIGNSNPRYRW